VKDVSRLTRVFAAGTGIGFLAGAFIVSVVVWHYGNIIGSRAAHLTHPPATPRAVERLFDPSDGLDDAGDALVVGQPAPVATSGEPSPVVAPAAPTEPVVGAVPAAELKDRDLLIPVEGVKAEQLTRTFSDRRSGGRTHEAMDILAPMNTPVVAVEGGTIARLFHSQAGGITIYQFDPSERFCYYYAHLSRYAESLREGQHVEKGQVIGYVGVSGNAPKNTPHLHFAIFRLTEAKRWWEGSALDPYEVLR
jgi:murein DD-endopeptidase MepM/ murein hydrolase activator NlpD